MKKRSFILASVVLMMSTSAAIATNSMNRSMEVFFINNGSVESTQVDFSCQPGDKTCVGISGTSAGKNLYADSQLAIPLERD